MSGCRREGCLSLPLPTSTSCFLPVPTSSQPMVNRINERGQISGMAIALSGPDAGHIHAFPATPVSGSMGISVADVAPTRPNISLPANVAEQPLQTEWIGIWERSEVSK